MSNDSQSLIDPKLLQRLGTPRTHMPEDRPSGRPYPSQGIVKSLEPPKQFGFSVPLTSPK